ncbi:MAG: hypothetical protein M0031_09475 [Thermaerobacter sp.]|nr:hypothetical protein [Thermaerobacter sp.]
MMGDTYFAVLAVVLLVFNTPWAASGEGIIRWMGGGAAVAAAYWTIWLTATISMIACLVFGEFLRNYAWRRARETHEKALERRRARIGEVPERDVLDAIREFFTRQGVDPGSITDHRPLADLIFEVAGTRSRWAMAPEERHRRGLPPLGPVGRAVLRELKQRLERRFAFPDGTLSLEYRLPLAEVAARVARVWPDAGRMAGGVKQEEEYL